MKPAPVATAPRAFAPILRSAIIFGILLNLGACASSTNSNALSELEGSSSPWYLSGVGLLVDSVDASETVQKHFLPSGSLVISRKMPSPVDSEHSTRMAPVLGYLPPDRGFLSFPYPGEPNGQRLKVNTGKNTVELVNGDNDALASYSAQIFDLPDDTSALSPYLLSKEQNSIWLASDAYFLNRGLLVPPKDSSLRGRIGALGEKSLVFSNGLLIHSSPVVVPEIGGIRLDPKDMEQIYSMLAEGVRIELVK